MQSGNEWSKHSSKILTSEEKTTITITFLQSIHTISDSIQFRRFSCTNVYHLLQYGWYKL